MLDFSSWLLFPKITRPPSPQDFMRFFWCFVVKTSGYFQALLSLPCLTSGMFHADQPIFFLISDVVYLLEISGPSMDLFSVLRVLQIFFLSYFSVPSVTAMGFEERLGPYPGLSLPSDKQRPMILK